MDAIIKPLNHHTLSQAIVLRDQVFPLLSKYEHATLEVSISDDDQDVCQKIGIRELEYWTALMKEDVAGLIGLYTELDDEDSVWLGWYCVDPIYRGQKIGKKLLSYAIDEANKRGYTCLKLYTSKINEYAVARNQYEQIGFEKYRISGAEIYYRYLL